MRLGENEQIVFTPAGANMHVFWTAHNFIEHHVDRERVILRYNCNYAADDNAMQWPIEGDILQIFFPHAMPDDTKSLLNHLYVTSIRNEHIHDKEYEAKKGFWSVRHDGNGITAEMRQVHAMPAGPGSVDFRIPVKYLWYSKLSPDDKVFCEDKTMAQGTVQYVIKEHGMRGQSEYAVKYPGQDRLVVQERKRLACAAPKCRFSAV